MKIQINVEIDKEVDEYKEYKFKDLSGEFGAKHLYKFIKPWNTLPSHIDARHNKRYYGCFHILTDHQIRDILSLCYYSAPHMLTELKLIIERPIEELSEVNDH